MFSSRSVKVGIWIVILGVITSGASAWCEVQAHLTYTPAVHDLGTLTQHNVAIKRDSTAFYLTSSMATRLFAIGAIGIIVGMLQIQRAQMQERVARLEKELETFRSRFASA